MDSKAQQNMVTTLISVVIVAFMAVTLINMVPKGTFANLVDPMPKEAKDNLDVVIDAFKTGQAVIDIPTKDTDTYAVFDQDHGFITYVKDNKELYLAKPSECGALQACVLYCEDLIDIENKGTEFFCPQPHTRKFPLNRGIRDSTMGMFGGIIFASGKMGIPGGAISIQSVGDVIDSSEGASTYEWQSKKLAESIMAELKKNQDLTWDQLEPVVQGLFDKNEKAARVTLFRTTNFGGSPMHPKFCAQIWDTKGSGWTFGIGCVDMEVSVQDACDSLDSNINFYRDEWPMVRWFRYTGEEGKYELVCTA